MEFFTSIISSVFEFFSGIFSGLFNWVSNKPHTPAPPKSNAPDKSAPEIPFVTAALNRIPQRIAPPAPPEPAPATETATLAPGYYFHTTLPSPPVVTSAKGTTAVMVIGDSHAAGDSHLGVPEVARGLDQYIKNLVENHTSASGQHDMVFVEGNPKGGTMLNQWSANGFLHQRLLDDIEKLQKTPADHKVVLISIGTNSMYGGEKLADIDKNLEAMLKAFHDAGIEVCWVDPPPGLPATVNSFVTKNPDGTPVIVPRRDDVLAHIEQHFDAHHQFAVQKLDMQSDQIHAKDYRQWAKPLFDFVVNDCLPNTTVTPATTPATTQVAQATTPNSTAR